MGWKQSIQQGSAKSWISNFNDKLASGTNVWDCISYANGKSYDDSRVKDISFYGEHNTTFTNRSAQILSENSSIDESNVTKIYEQKFFFDGTEDSKQNLVNAIKQINYSFNPEEYEMNVYQLKDEGGYYTIDFVYKEGEFYTNSSYTLMVKDNYVSQITENTKEISLSSRQAESILVTENMIDTAKKYAKDSLLSNQKNSLFLQGTSSKIKIREQEIKLFKDMETNKRYIQVFNTYSYGESIDKACELYEYEI